MKEQRGGVIKLQLTHIYNIIQNDKICEEKYAERKDKKAEVSYNPAIPFLDNGPIIMGKYIPPQKICKNVLHSTIHDKRKWNQPKSESMVNG